MKDKNYIFSPVNRQPLYKHVRNYLEGVSFSIKASFDNYIKLIYNFITQHLHLYRDHGGTIQCNFTLSDWYSASTLHRLHLEILLVGHVYVLHRHHFERLLLPHEHALHRLHFVVLRAP